MEELKYAKDFASKAHGNQKRKFTGEPYIVHTEETAQLLWSVTDGQAPTDMYIAAILHDVVEDTEIKLEEVRDRFGDIVADLVEELTINEDSKKLEGKRPYLSRKMNEMSNDALTIKLCDRFSNVSCLQNKKVTNDFAKWYITETDYLINNLSRTLSGPQEELVSKIKNMLLFVKLNRNL